MPSTNRFFFIALIGAIMMLAALGTDAMLPSFPQIASDFQTSEAAAQRILTIFMYGYALPHLLIGSLADRFGRKPILLTGLSIFFIGGILCYLAPTFELLLAGRFIQGMGAAAGPILARAILRDLFQGSELGRYLSFAMVFFAAGPVLAPSIGAAIQAFFNWRGIFVFLCIFAIALMLLVSLRLKETLERKDPNALQTKVILKNARAFLAHPQSLGALLVLSFAYGSLVAFLASSPTIYMVFYGVSERTFALLFATISATTFFTQFVNANLLKRYSSAQILRVTLVLHLFVTLGLFLQTYFEVANLVTTTLNFSAFFMVFPLILANGTTLAIDPHKTRAGVASGLLGFSNLLIGTTLATIIGSFVSIGPTPLAFGMLLISIACLVTFIVFRRHLLKPTAT